MLCCLMYGRRTNTSFLEVLEFLWNRRTNLMWNWCCNLISPCFDQNVSIPLKSVGEKFTHLEKVGKQKWLPVFYKPKNGRSKTMQENKAMNIILLIKVYSAKLEITGAYVLINRKSNHRKTWLDIVMTIIINLV